MCLLTYEFVEPVTRTQITRFCFASGSSRLRVQFDSSSMHIFRYISFDSVLSKYGFYFGYGRPCNVIHLLAVATTGYHRALTSLFRGGISARDSTEIWWRSHALHVYARPPRSRLQSGVLSVPQWIQRRLSAQQNNKTRLTVTYH